MAARAAGLRVIRLDRYCREPSDDAICSLSELLA